MWCILASCKFVLCEPSRSRLKNQRKSRRDPRYAPADIVALMRWSMVISKEQRRKNISHPPNSAPLVRAFINKADQISNGNSNIWTDENEKGSTTGMPSTGGPSTSHTGNTRQNAMNFTLANMYRLVTRYVLHIAHTSCIYSNKLY